ncbi:type I-E CRISPR-associated protein Cas6/Cse3/CasE [Nocardiopsis rhodophaea]|uniref:type I-E CRISPR-associated protein Cas6/Cse3/CasE n=1 Tax=Nocardiopsis rhodophaea TaxID=280238 RepID=UPI0031D6A6FF
MYLSRTFINPRRKGAVPFLGNPQKIHAAVLQAFPQTPPTDAAEGPRVLWRLDTDDWRRPVLWTLSPERPDFSHVVEPYGWPNSGTPAETREYAPLLDRIAEGQEYVFRVTVNPAKAKVPSSEEKWDSDGKLKRGTVVPLVGANNQIAWFADRAPKWGFELLPGSVPMPETDDPENTPPAYAVEIRDSRKLKFWKGEGRGERVTLLAVTLEGKLRVKDVEVFRRSLTHGIGRAKGYGCGLISLAASR